MSDTLYILPGSTFYPDLDGAPTGLVGILAVTITRKADNVIVSERSTSAIAEAPADSGHYTATRVGPAEAGEYLVTWDDGSGPEAVAFDDIVVTADLPNDTAVDSEYPWAPTVAEVAALIRARTKVPGGKEVGTFTENTRVTRTEAEALILQAVDHVAASIGGDPCNDKLRNSARAASAMLAAILIEQSYWPESAEARGSSAARLEALFNARMKSLTASVAEQCGGQGTGGTDDGNSGALAAGHFSDGHALIGRDYPCRW